MEDEGPSLSASEAQIVNHEYAGVFEEDKLELLQVNDISFQ